MEVVLGDELPNIVVAAQRGDVAAFTELVSSGAATLLHTQAVGQSMAHEDAALQAAPL